MFDSCLVLKNDGYDHLWQPLSLARVWVHLDAFRRLMVGMEQWTQMEPLHSMTSSAGQLEKCTKVLSNWVCRGEMPGSRRYSKRGIECFTTGTLPYQLKKMEGVDGKQVQERGWGGIFVSVKLNISNKTVLGPMVTTFFFLNGESSFEELTSQNTKSHSNGTYFSLSY